jgi:hypothetical protein
LRILKPELQEKPALNFKKGGLIRKVFQDFTEISLLVSQRHLGKLSLALKQDLGLLDLAGVLVLAARQ